MLGRLSLWLACLCACGGAAAPGAGAPTTPSLLPETRAGREALLEHWGRRLHRAIARDGVADLWFDEWALRAVLEPERATRASLQRMHGLERLRVPAAARTAFGQAEFAGVCVQSARIEPAAGPVGLGRPGWVFDRVLVVAQEPGGVRIAAWVEGAFLLTDQGLGALVIDRVEAPRRDHADLQLATCDLAVGLH